MKKLKKILATALAFGLCSSALPSITVQGADDPYYQHYWGAVTEIIAPEGGKLVNCPDLANAFGSPANVYQVIESEFFSELYVVYCYDFNYTNFLIAPEDAETFEAVYEEYAALLDFDTLHTLDLPYVINYQMSDRLDENGEWSKDPADFEDKQELVIQFCNALQERGVTPLEARYHAVYADYRATYDNSRVTLLGVDPEEMDNIAAIAAAYDSHDDYSQVIYGNFLDFCEIILSDEQLEIVRDGIEWEMEQDEDMRNDNIWIIGVVDMSDRTAMIEALLEAYPEASIHKYGYIFYDDASDIAATEAVDLLTAQPSPEPPVATDTTQPDVPTATATTGDLDGDGAITIQDAYQTLMAYANASAGLEDGLSEAQRKAVDVDGDGAVTIQDAYKILCYYADASAGLEPSWT